MPTTFHEGNLRFVFQDGWQVNKYDDHAFYRNRVSKLPNTAAVDFVGHAPDAASYFIEVKDFRGYRIQNKRRLTTDELATEVARKVRDSVAGVIGCKREYPNPEALGFVADRLHQQSTTMRVVLWLEDDLAQNQRVWQAHLLTITDRIKTYLKWLTARVVVVSLSTHVDKPPGLHVTNLAGAGQAGS
jgi:hypothetical protein